MYNQEKNYTHPPINSIIHFETYRAWKVLKGKGNKYNSNTLTLLTSFTIVAYHFEKHTTTYVITFVSVYICMRERV